MTVSTHRSPRRYLPFEGTGAVSTWRLEVNGVDGTLHRQTQSDVIMTVRYTARTGGSAFAETVKSALGGKSRDSAWLLNLATDFSDKWQAFINKPSSGMTFSVERSLPLIEQGQGPAWQLVPTGSADKFSTRNLRTIALVVTYASKASF